MQKKRDFTPPELLEVVSVIEGDEGIEQEILLPGDQRYRLLRELKMRPGSYRIVDGRDSELATFGGYWRGRANRWFVTASRERAAHGRVLPSDWQSEFHVAAQRTRKLLLEWIELWLSAKKNTEAMMKEHPDVDAILRDYVARQRAVILWSVSGPSRTIIPADFTASDVDEAARLFLGVMFHPICVRMDKCDRCGRIYLGKTARANKRYCSRTCGNADRNQRPSVLESERDKIMMLRSAADAVRQWQPRHGDQKRWIASRVNKALGNNGEHIKTNWVTLNWEDIKALAEAKEG